METITVFENDNGLFRIVEFEEVHRAKTGGVFAVNLDRNMVTLCILTPEEDETCTDYGLTLCYYEKTTEEALSKASAHAKMLADADVSVGEGIVRTLDRMEYGR